MNRLVFIITSSLMTGASASTVAGDPAAGQLKAQACVACHGADGNSTTSDFPSLAGQVPGYIAGQLAAFKSGKRANPIMMGLAQPLSAEDIDDIDAWYASQTIVPRSINEDQLALASEGESLYRAGSAELAIPACMACHGPAGHGIPSNYPRVAGQWPEYLESQLLAFKSAERTGKIMGPISHRLSAHQIHALSVYMSALQ
ncbi:MAG: c-type cytochrome [Arenicellales bacterium]|nr:c-type cytochrome [Arenicellales bacterium]